MMIINIFSDVYTRINKVAFYNKFFRNKNMFIFIYIYIYTYKVIQQRFLVIQFKCILQYLKDQYF